MIKRALATVSALLLVCSAAFAGTPDGLIVKPSAHGVGATLDRLERIVRDKGATVFVRVDHAGGAERVGMELRPTQLLIFGNPKLGTHFFTSAQSAGIDLPMKVLAWEDAEGQVWVAYNDPQYIAQRHGIDDRDEVAKKMRAALDGMVSAAVGR